ncbi:hypothetical protein GGI35DRAFT_322526 [Trichoderma velutinum]
MSEAPVPASSKSSMAVQSSINQTNYSMPIIRFTNIDDLKRAMYATLADKLFVTDVPPAVFKTLLDEYDKHKIRISTYNEDSRYLITTITYGPHERLYAPLDRELVRQIDNMGLGNNWLVRGIEYYPNARPSSGGSGGGGGKMPDASGGPRDKRLEPSYPTIVMEAGYSETLLDLQRKARDWFRDSNHDIKIVLLAKFDPAQQKIIIQRWEERQQGEGRPGAATRWASEWIPGCQQEITITRNRASPSGYEVTSSDLILSFRLLFLRDPRQGEGDIVIPVSWMQGQYAADVWRAWDVLQR